MVSDPLTRPTTCETCDTPFDATGFDLLGHTVWQRNCPACVHAYDSKAATAPERLSAWQKLCPALYQETDTERLTAAKLARVMAWQHGRRGLIIHGPSRQGKTRLMWLLLKRLLNDERREVVWHDGASFGRQCGEAFGDSRGEEWLQRIVTAEIWFIDDLGQFKLTERVEESLWSVVEHRTRELRPILATTQWVGDELVKRFVEEERGKAVVNRLREFCESVSV